MDEYGENRLINNIHWELLYKTYVRGTGFIT